jgi:hypothetical protein
MFRAFTFSGFTMPHARTGNNPYTDEIHQNASGLRRLWAFFYLAHHERQI